MEEQEEYRVDKGALIEALCKAMLEFEPITKDSKARVKTKSGSEYTYDYVSLDLIIISTRKALANNGLNIRHYIEFKPDGKSWLISELRHSSGCDPDKTESPIDKFTGDSYMSVVQNYGSIMTYLRRYHMALLLNIAIDEDTDGNEQDKGKTDKQDNHGKDNLDRITEQEISQILENCKAVGLETETQALNKVKAILTKNLKSLGELTMPEFHTVIKAIGSSKVPQPSGEDAAKTNGNDKDRKRAFALANKLLMSNEEIKVDILREFGLETRKDMTDVQWMQYCDYLLAYEKKMVTDEQVELMKSLPKPYKELTQANFITFVNSNLEFAKSKTKNMDGTPVVHVAITKPEYMSFWEADYIIRTLKSIAEAEKQG